MWAVLDYTNTKLVERELLLVKTSILGPEMLHKQLPDTYPEEKEEHTEIDEAHDEEVNFHDQSIRQVQVCAYTDFGS